MSNEQGARATIVVGVHNRWDALKACLESLLTIDCCDFEVVVVDDASNDDTPAQLESFRQHNDRVPIRVVRSEENLGPAGARNLGIDAAAGEFVCFLDSDCVVDRQWLTQLLAPLDAPEFGGVCGAIIESPPKTWADHAFAGESYYGRKGQNFHEANMALRRDLALQYRFDDALRYGAEGDDLARRMRSDGWKIAFAAEAVVTHHHPMTLRAYLKRAYLLGQGAARFWYKHNIFVGRDLVPLACALATLPLAVFDLRLLAIPGFLAGLQVLAIVFNEMYFKGKSIARMLYVLPLSLLAYVFRAAGVLGTYARILLGRETAVRQSKHRFRTASQTAERLPDARM